MERTTETKHRTEHNGAEAVRLLSRLPVICPVGKCSETLFPSNLMMHMLDKHGHPYEDRNMEIYDHLPVRINFNSKDFQYDDNQCIATLSYGGVKDHPSTQPGLSYLSIPNAALTNEQHKYDNFLPIMVMVCRTSWFNQIKDDQLKTELNTMHGYKAGIYIFWLVAPETTRKLYYTLTVFDSIYHNSRSVLRVVRGIPSSQNPSEFLSDEDNYLLLRDSEILELMSTSKSASIFSSQPASQKRAIPMELVVFENPLKSTKSAYGQQVIPRTKGALPRTVNGKLSLTKKPLSKTATCM